MPIRGRPRVSFGAIAPLLALGFAAVLVVGIAVRLMTAARTRTKRTDGER